MTAHYLVTGGAGFIGRHLCAELLAQGHKVRVLDSLIDQVHGDAAPQLPGDVDLLRGDVRDIGLIDRALSGVDGVFHLAAEVGVGQSMYEIARYVGANDLGTAVLLERLASTPVRRLVVASSMSVYGEGLYVDDAGRRHDNVKRIMREGSSQWDPVGPDGGTLHPVATDESKPVDLASVYAVTKFVQERNCLIVGRAYGIEAVALRLFNVFGPGQALSNPYTGVLANFGARLLHGQQPLVFEDGRQRRDFVHVRDVARAFRLAMEVPAAAGEVINIGSGRSYEIAQIATMLADAMDVPHLVPHLLGKARAGDIRHNFADIGRARTLLGYEPRHPLEQTIDEAAAWIRGSQATDRGEDARRQLEARGLMA
ncbi:NAD-dependent epimerase/dehydratase family protein [Lichenicoccus roseus]|uniref:NAD-dependent epimerase/dehydratase family protein n=1 Tax=Lichenicoccus roseus TaxID=2683649 RepID=A0A5R9J8Z5_9PROT|nr:NAD-dependent epimerase/dehydratase family protein [Lichenicoccus roseus]TLU74094.1 NAD-dependent epimerase/dehydratase family protein [Lichenicoccus roseus]